MYSMSWKLYLKLQRKGWFKCSSIRRSRMMFLTLSDRTTKEHEAKLSVSCTNKRIRLYQSSHLLLSECTSEQRSGRYPSSPRCGPFQKHLCLPLEGGEIGLSSLSQDKSRRVSERAPYNCKRQVRPAHQGKEPATHPRRWSTPVSLASYPLRNSIRENSSIAFRFVKSPRTHPNRCAAGIGPGRYVMIRRRRRKRRLAYEKEK